MGYGPGVRFGKFKAAMALAADSGRISTEELLEVEASSMSAKAKGPTVVGLSFFPVLTLGPALEHLQRVEYFDVYIPPLLALAESIVATYSLRSTD